MKKSIFDEPKPWIFPKKGLFKRIRDRLNEGYEISFITTPWASFDWADINQNLDAFLKKLEQTKQLEFSSIMIAWLRRSDARILYDLYEVIPDYDPNRKR